MRHLQEFSGLKSIPSSSQLIWAGLLCGLLVSGCAQPPDLEALEGSTEAAPTFDSDFPNDPDLGLIRDGVVIKVGDPVDRALSAFPRPDGAYDVNRPPTAFESEFQASGWEQRRMGFAVMHKGGVIASALWREKGLDSEDINRRVRQYELRFGPADQMVPSTVREVQQLQYWFWEGENERLCLVSTVDFEGELAFVAAVGRPDVLDALRMNPSAAREDIERAMEMLRTDEPEQAER